jgi:carboxylesterase
VLALHGFTGTPQEVDLVIRAAADRGLAGLAPLLPGHGTHARDLADTRFEDWLSAAKRDADALFDARPGPADRLILAGFSMGALLAMEIALSHPERVAGLILLSSAIDLHWPYPALALDAIDRLGIRDFWMPKAHSDLGDGLARRRHLTYSAQPVHAAISVRRAGQRLAQRASELQMPLFLAHGERDHVCPFQNSERIYAAAASSHKRLLRLRRSQHIITRDVDRPQLYAGLGRFLDEVLALEAARAPESLSI